MAIEYTLASRLSNALQIAARQGRDCVFATLGQQNLATRLEKLVDALPAVAEYGYSAGGRFEQPARRAKSHLRHSPSGHVQREARRAIERCMIGRRYVPHIVSIRLPGKGCVVHGAADDKAAAGQAPRGFDEKGMKRRVAILCIGSQVGEIGRVS